MKLNSTEHLREEIDVATEPAGLVPNTARPHRTALRVLVCGSALLAAVACATAPAGAEPSDDGSTSANVEVTTAITLTGLTGEFTMSGMPGATIAGSSIVELNVETNNLAGYLVTVQSRTPVMLAREAGNADAVPIDALSVRGSGAGDFTALGATAPVTVHSQPFRSAAGGDDLSNDYRIVIPFVREDVYSAALDYVATTL